ncbi:MAG: ATP-dependent RecD-like DNA helicase [Lachnospiraceae bacterium]|nr:ATP-dependent RecD-like DNA helicase [Lachnospiraceae bacterium]
MSTLSGYVEHIVYRNEENGYTVMEMVDKGKEYTVVGSFPRIAEGEYLEVTGTEKKHPLYGNQLVMESYEWKIPADAAAIERYLASGAIKGVGAALAARIVKKFGDDTFRIMEEEPERLAEIKGISMKGAMQIATQMAERQDMRQAMVFLQEFGITMNLAAKIYERYGSQVYDVLRTNPYRLAEDITGIGFRIADEIAAKAGISPDSDYRIKCGIFYALQQALNNGHVYLPERELLTATQELLGVSLESLEKQIMDLTVDRKIIVREMDAETAKIRRIYLSKYYYMEMNCARMLTDLNLHIPDSEMAVESRIRRIEREEKLELDEHQRSAVKEAAGNGLLILTGGPGTGKTTTIKAIIHYFEQEDMEVLLAAPTGRAAKRMSEATGREARTIHRMLELSGGQDETVSEGRFARDEQNPLECDAIVIDEVSMVDINLLHALLRAITVGTRLILVGDVNQLPSVGPGNVLRDVIRSECYPVVRLTKIFRQAAASDIIVNAHRINAGEHISTAPGSKDFLFIHRDQPQTIMNAVIGLVRDKLPPYVQAAACDIQVMTPMRKGTLGVENLNMVLQQFLNPADDKKKEKELPHGIFREGDKVMQIKNNYQMEWEITNRYGIPIDAGTGVFNGDIGVIREINLFAEELVVEFDEGKQVHYSFKEADELELAYAITIHKSQGSEYPAVVIPVHSGPRMLMTRNLLYTAVTRAKKCVCIVGLDSSFTGMIDNRIEQKRYSSLDEQIRSFVEPG